MHMVTGVFCPLIVLLDIGYVRQTGEAKSAVTPGVVTRNGLVDFVDIEL